MALLRISWQYGILPDDLERSLTVSQMNEIQAFMNVWPDGADAMDRRFEALRMDLRSLLDHVAYYMSRGKGTKPKRLKIESFRLFTRGKALKRTHKYLDEMESQEAVAKRMTAFARGIVASGRHRNS